MEWKPKRWLAALLSLVNAPFGFCYVQRVRLAFGYLLASITLQILIIGLAVTLGGGWATGVSLLAVAVLNIVAAVHAFRLAGAFPTSSTQLWYSRWYGLLAIVLTFYGVALVFRSFLYEPFQIPSQAMYPTLPENSFVVVKKLGYGDYGSVGLRFSRVPATAAVARGDLLLFRRADDAETVYVKRVIGLPGEHVECLDRVIVINGTPIATQPESRDAHYQYVNESIDGVSFTVAHLVERPAARCDVVVPEGHYFMLGDNRRNSRDSRHFGAISRDHLVGRVAAILRARTP